MQDLPHVRSLSSTESTTQNQTVILSIGDSITQGSGIPGGYRRHIYDILSADGYNIKSVGSKMSNCYKPCVGCKCEEIKRHDGHGGKQIAYISDNIEAWIRKYSDKPDVILLLIGTNDFGYYGIPNEFPDVIKRWDELIYKLTDLLPDAHIIASNLIKRTVKDYEDSIQIHFNPYVEDIVKKHAIEGNKVSFIDLRSMLSLEHLADSVHPNEAGYLLMGQGWAKAIQDVFSPQGNRYPPKIFNVLVKHDLSKVILTFSTVVADDSVEAHFTLDRNAIVTAVTLDSSKKKLFLEVKGMVRGHKYTLQLEGITDRTEDRLSMLEDTKQVLIDSCVDSKSMRTGEPSCDEVASNLTLCTNQYMQLHCPRTCNTCKNWNEITQYPTLSPMPSMNPTKISIDSPTFKPSSSPSLKPSSPPSFKPSIPPPSLKPSDSPSSQPTDSPTSQPTDSPTSRPTNSPISQPTNSPTSQPTISPTKPFVNPIFILPLGDSITTGSSVPGGYRKILYSSLSRNGYNIRYVGSMQTNCFGGCLETNRKHEGRDKAQIPFVIENIHTWRKKYEHDPDVILLLLGRNDLEKNNALSKSVIKEWDKLIYKITDLMPHANIIASNLLSTRKQKINQAINKQFNAYVEEIVNKHAREGHKVTYVDLNSIVKMGFMPDGTHPGYKGYQLMASAWKSAIEEVITPEGDMYPPQVVDVILGHTLRRITITFSKALFDEEISKKNFIFNGNVKVSQVTSDMTKRIVQLNVEGIKRGVTYYMRINKLTDRTKKRLKVPNKAYVVNACIDSKEKVMSTKLGKYVTCVQVKNKHMDLCTSPKFQKICPSTCKTCSSCMDVVEKTLLTQKHGRKYCHEIKDFKFSCRINHIARRCALTCGKCA